MKNKIHSFTITIIFLLLISIILTNNSNIIQSIIDATELWSTRILPSLFPMFVISDILSYYGLATFLSKLLTPLTKKIFNVSGISSYIFIMSLLSGCPSNAYITKELLQNGRISNSDATKVLCFSFFSNPLFLLAILSNIFPNNNTLVIKIILIHYLSNILVGILLKNHKQIEPTYEQIIVRQVQKSQDFGTILTNSIKKSMNTLITILGTVIFYIIISTAIIELFNFENLSSNILKGILEITQGLNSLINSNQNETIKSILAISFISFGGLSIHTQIKSILNDTEIKYSRFLKARILHAIIATIILIILK